MSRPWALVAVAGGVIALATLVPLAPSADGSRIPFWCLMCGDYDVADAVVNVALFAPFGWAVARVRPRLSTSLGIVLTATIGVELLQYGFIRGRVASFSDILANTAGGVIGIALPPLGRRFTASGERALRGATVYGLLAVLGLGTGTAVLAIPRPEVLRWTEGNPARPGYAPFTGSLQAVRFDGTAVVARNWFSVPRREVAEVAIDIVSGRPDERPAQVIVLWMPNGLGWMWVDQRDRDLRVHLASTSDRLSVRGNATWIRNVMPTAAGEAVTVGVVVRPYSYRIAVTTTAGEVVQTAAISPADGWRLFVPFERERDAWASLLGAMWMAILAGPLGYLASVRSRATAMSAAAGAGLGVLLLPILLGCAWPPLMAWLGAGSGFLVGVGAGVRN